LLSASFLTIHEILVDGFFFSGWNWNGYILRTGFPDPPVGNYWMEYKIAIRNPQATLPFVRGIPLKKRGNSENFQLGSTECVRANPGTDSN